MAKEVKKLIGRLNLETGIGDRNNKLIVSIKTVRKSLIFYARSCQQALVGIELYVYEINAQSVNRQVNCETANLGKNH
jgi:DNA-binding transcriptional regulator WhiA